MKTFSQFLFEAIPLSKYRKAMKGKSFFGSSTIEKISKEYKTRYKDWFEGKWRIFLPLDEHATSEIYSEVNSKLQEFNYSIKDWENGLARSSDSNREVRIGKFLFSKGEKDLAFRFNERFKGKVAADKNDDYEIVISRHPYDTLGQSYNRDWDSCKNLTTETGNGSNRQYLPTEINAGCLVAYVIRKADKDNISHIISDKEAGHVYYQIFEHDKMYLLLKGYTDIHFRSDLRQGKIDLSKIEKDLGIKLDLKKGIKDPLQKPISRILIIPYANEDKPEDTFLYAVDSVYGKHIEGFRETVQKWLDSKQGKKTGNFKLDTDKIYNDGNPQKLTKITLDNPTIEDFDTLKKQFYIFKSIPSFSTKEKKIIKEKYNEYLLSVEDLNKLVVHQDKTLRLVEHSTLKTILQKYRTYFNSHKDVYEVVKHYENSYGGKKLIKLLPLADTLLKKLRNSILDEDDDLLDLYMDTRVEFKHALKSQQERNQDIVFFDHDEYTEVPLFVRDAVESNNKSIHGKDVVTLDGKLMVPVDANQFDGEMMTHSEAIEACNKLELDGYTDWYLPSLEEMQLTYKHKDELRNIPRIASYWTTTEFKGSIESIQTYYSVFSLPNGRVLGDTPKFSEYLVFPVRKVK